ncbi:MAG: hypothetical protein DI616_05085 [Paracoccus denitrificans]|uniref:Uncharacterized protein n=1 Tax=Paracoccus denitrificans TaxID=266 RepID=A0A533ID36_PARDE|nr:MAG: hypothetical protein DI616_05085 [Paracoccus denitrificans]
MGVRRNRIIVLIVLLVIVSLPAVGLLTLDSLMGRSGQTEVQQPPRPAGVPADAVFRGGPDGGYFIRLLRDDFALADGGRLPAYHLSVWPDAGGSVEYAGPAIFVSDRGMDVDGERYVLRPPSVATILRSAYFNGVELRFDIGEHARFGRIIPLEVHRPSDMR